MQPRTRVILGVAAAVGCALVLMTLFSSGWYHSPLDPVYAPGKVDWYGFGGPYGDHSTVGYAGQLIAGLCAFMASASGALAALGTLAGARRNHVPRLPALLAALLAPPAVLFQAIAIATWPRDHLADPHGFGWAMPAYFTAAVALAVAASLLHVDARARAKASAASLARVEREMARRDLAGFPDLAAEEPIERL